MPSPNERGPNAVVWWAVGKLAVDFPASFPDEATTRGRVFSFRELLEAHEWVTAPVFERAVHLVRWKHQGPFIPQPAVWLDYCQAAADDLERQRRERQAKLPPPRPPTDDERRAAEDRTEAAKLKARLSLPERLRRKYTPSGGRL